MTQLRHHHSAHVAPHQAGPCHETWPTSPCSGMVLGWGRAMPVRTPFQEGLILAVSLLLPLCGAKVANAAEINVLSGRGFSPVLDAVVGDFEQKTGHTVKISYRP